MPPKKPSIQLDPSPYSARSNPPALIPLYYTSDLFVDPLREDISNLLDAFAEHFEEGKEPPSQPFSLFKSIWIDHGWDLFHLMCNEPRSRWTFLKTVFRCFIERIEQKESGAVQAAALFGLYAFYGTQPDASTGYTYLNKIPIAIDTYVYVLTLPKVVPPPLSNHVLYVLNTFLEDDTFTILPDSSLHPYQTRDLPNATLVPYEYSAKDGRPTKPQLVTRTRHAVNKLDTWVQAMDAAKVPETLDAFSGFEEQESRAGPSGSSSATPLTGRSALPPDSHTEQPPSEHLKAKAKGRKKVGTSTASAQLDFTPPDMSSYVDLKSKLKGLVPADILHEAEADTRRTMEQVSSYARDNDIVPEGDWNGAKRVLEQDGLLDFIKAPPPRAAAAAPTVVGVPQTEETMEVDEH